MPWAWVGRINIGKQGNLKTECNPYQITKGIFHRIGTKNPTPWMEKQKPPCSESNLKRENRAGRIRLPDFILYYKATVIKTVWYCHKNRNIDQWKRIEGPEINSHTYGQLIYNKGDKTT